MPKKEHSLDILEYIGISIGLTCTLVTGAMGLGILVGIANAAYHITYLYLIS